MLPNARVVYCSATGVSDVHNMASFSLTQYTAVQGSYGHEKSLQVLEL